MRNSNAKPVILFPHLAKTAGVTAVTLLERAFEGHTFGAYFQENVSGTGLIDLEYIASKFNELPEEKRDEVQFIPSHMGFGLHAHLPFECKYITFIRDPVDRIISSYNYVRGLGWRGVETSFEEFVNMSFLGSNNHMVRALSGDPSLDTFDKPALQSSVRPVTEEDFQRTIQNIEEHFVSCIPVSSFDAGLTDFFCQWNLPPAGMRYERQNVTKVKEIGPPQLSEKILEKVRELNVFDLRLHAYVVAEFEKKYQKNKRRYDALNLDFSKFQDVYQKVSGMQDKVRTNVDEENSVLLSLLADAEALKLQIADLANMYIHLHPSDDRDHVNDL